MVNLDNLSVNKKFDRSGMMTHLRSFPAQCLDGWKKAGSLLLPPDYRGADKVVITGMGGSAIGGEIMSNLLATECPVPVWIHRDFGLPRFADVNTLVIVVSYSGNTEETLSAFDAAMKTGAKIMVLTSGGKLAELAQNNKIPISVIDYQAKPRAAFGYIFGSLAAVFNKLGFLSAESVNISAVAEALGDIVNELDIDVPVTSNRAKQLALKLNGKIAVVYGAGPLAGVARRWKAQINENSKQWAFFEVFPELVHNAIAGYPYPQEVKEKLFVILLRAPFLHPRVGLQYDAVTSILSENNVAYEIVESPAGSTFQQALNAVLLGDFISYYLAVLNKVDPTPLPAVDYIKQRMAGS